jgi:hypothetical protein
LNSPAKCRRAVVSCAILRAVNLPVGEGAIQFAAVDAGKLLFSGRFVAREGAAYQTFGGGLLPQALQAFTTASASSSAVRAFFGSFFVASVGFFSVFITITIRPRGKIVSGLLPLFRCFFDRFR